MLPMLLLIALAAGAPDEAMGRVSKVVDGDTFDITVTEGDSRVMVDDVIRIRLADIDTPEVRGAKACEAGKKASAYTKMWLLGRMVSLDLDDKTGKDQYDRWVAVCYNYLRSKQNTQKWHQTDQYGTLKISEMNKFQNYQRRIWRETKHQMNHAR